MVPPKLLLSQRLRYVSRVSLATSVGIVPDNKLADIIKSRRFDKLPTSVGICPPTLFSPILSKVRAVRRPISEGKVPVRPVFSVELMSTQYQD